MLWPTARLEKAFRLESEGVSSPLPVVIFFFLSFFSFLGIIKMRTWFQGQFLF